ncbi:hypothetical protein F5148DRAFT_427132 [Russula earlei]|uniref:Uncharacterized protein n=1 Tax=Russula earlei TaxID=71964 RepID=A0ACC0TZE4_9AGAM|nr:hypothetical protein F5148DRAFT_427132 [Russula earlei]
MARDIQPRQTQYPMTRPGKGFSFSRHVVFACAKSRDSFIDGRPKTAAEMQREKRLRDDPLADLLGPLFVSCRRCGTRIKLSPKSSYDPFHWVKHRERCLRRSIEAVKEILREKEEDQARSSLSAVAPQRNSKAVVADTQSATPPQALSPLPSLQRRRDTDSTTPSLIADEDEVDKLSHSSLSHSGQREPPDGQEEHIFDESDGSPGGSGEGTQPLCSLAVFRAPDMLAFEDYLHRSRRLPTRLGFPDLLPSPDRWHDWSWARLRAPVYVVPKRPEGAEGAAACAAPPLSSHGDAGGGSFHSEAHHHSVSLGDLPRLHLAHLTPR